MSSFRDAFKDQNGKFRFPEGSISAAAFLLSLALAFGTLWQALRGSSVDLLEPREVVFYREPGKNAASVAMALKIPIVSSSKDFNDFMISAEAQPLPGEPWFGLNAPVDLIRTENSVEASRLACPAGRNCYPEFGLAAAEQTDDSVAIEGGRTTALTYAFRLVCARDATDCTGYGLEADTLKMLAGKPLNITVRLSFKGDGTKEVKCRTAPFSSLYVDALKKSGWTTLDCEKN